MVMAFMDHASDVDGGQLRIDLPCDVGGDIQGPF